MHDLEPSGVRRLGLAVVLAIVLIGVAAGTAAAQETRTGDTVTVATNETVEGDLSAVGGTVIVRGTVDGDLEAFGGNVQLADTGRVAGDVEAVAGNVRIAGAVDGRTEAVGGNVYVGPEATLGGLEAAAGNVEVLGTIAGDARLAGGTVVLHETATIEGNLTYSASEFDDRGATVSGAVAEEEDIQVGPAWADPTIPTWAGFVYGVLAELLLGALILALLPAFATGAADQVSEEPLYTGAIGLVALIAVPIVLVLVAITVVGIPLALLGALLYAFAIWAGVVLGEFAVGTWLLSLADVHHRWAALVVGVVAVGLVGLVPILGGLVEFLVLLLGLGALSLGVVRGYRARRGGAGTANPAPDERRPGDEGRPGDERRSAGGTGGSTAEAGR